MNIQNNIGFKGAIIAANSELKRSQIKRDDGNDNIEIIEMPGNKENISVLIYPESEKIKENTDKKALNGKPHIYLDMDMQKLQFPTGTRYLQEIAKNFDYLTFLYKN